jgi:hypothetical protein
MKSKIAVAVLALASIQAHAKDILYAPNQIGGMIVLTDYLAPNCPAGSKQYYTTDANGQNRTYGCWVYNEPWIYAKDSSGTFHTYPITGFAAVGQ